MSESLWLALALVCVLEGIVPFLFPRLWKETFLRIASLREGQIRFTGLMAILVGITLLLF